MYDKTHYNKKIKKNKEEIYKCWAFAQRNALVVI